MGCRGRTLFGLAAATLLALPVYADESWTPPPLTRQDNYDPFVQTVSNGAAATQPTPAAAPAAPTAPAPSNSTGLAPLIFSLVSNNPQPVVAASNNQAVAAGAPGCGCPAPACQPACPCACPCANPFEHHTSVWAEYLYLRAFDIDMAHGIQQNGVGGLGTAPAGEVGTAAPQFDSGFRVGCEIACDTCSGVRVAYTQYDTSTSNQIFAGSGVGDTTASLVLFPNTITAASTFDSLTAHYDIGFRLGDIDYAVLLTGSDVAALNYGIGVRYAHLDQGFAQLGEFAGATGEELTTSSISFDGVGLRTGFDGSWRLHNTRFAVYGKTFLNLVFGQFNSSYLQRDVTTSTDEAFSHWTDSRVMPILDVEAGVQWVSCSGCCKVSAGYYTSYWFNAIDTAEFIQAVQSQTFTNASQTIAFTGLAAHVEVRF